ncbi:MAG: S41 family peptidase [Acidobacteria bacterium]|nr:S41 family peptidase [Acidobacteriota bacterium]
MKQKSWQRSSLLLIIPLLFAATLTPASNNSSNFNFDGSPVAESVIEAYSLIENNYAGEIDHERLSYSTISEMLHVLDPHSAFYTKEDFQELRSQQQSEYFGIGATVSQRQNKVYILAPHEGTPAARAGLLYGDQIVLVNGKSTEGWNSNKVATELRGPRGTQVKVGVSRPGVDKPIEVSISRDAVSLPSIPNVFMIKPNVGYIGLRRQFARTTGEELVLAMKELKQKGMNELILDLRDNPGGLVQAALDVCDTFLAPGQKILSIKGRKAGAERSFEVRSSSAETMPIVVLVNSGSASASEIVSGALQDHDRGRIVGEVTFGKGLVQTIFPIANGTGLTLTTAKYYTPSGRLIQRDYTGVSRYNYYLRRDEKNNSLDKNPKSEFRTDSGQVVYGGGGISPDVTVKERRFTPIQGRLQDPIFFFVRELINNQTPGFNQYQVKAMNFKYELKTEDLLVSDELVAAFKSFTLKREKDFQISEANINENLDTIKLFLRRELATASYGIDIGQEVLLHQDPQVLKGLDEMDNARKLTQKSNSVANK